MSWLALSEMDEEVGTIKSEKWNCESVGCTYTIY